MQTLKVTDSSAVLHVTLNRPDVRNAFSAEMIAEITQVFREAASRPDLRAIVLRGEGKVFCSGADLGYMREMVNFSFSKNEEDALLLHEMFETIASCPMPIVTLVHGAAFGGALGLIAASDVVFAEDGTQFCFSEVRLGLVPAVISDFILRKTPLGSVAPWMLTGQVFGCSEAMRLGLVHRAGSNEAMSQSLEECLKSFRETGLEAVRATKALIHQVPRLSAAAARSETARVIAERRVSAEGQEGLKAFLEKRTPQWGNR